MNATRRKTIAHAIEEAQRLSGLVDELRSTVNTIAEEEREAFDNLSEGLQQSEKGQESDAAANSLEEAVGNLEEAVSSIDSATANLEGIA